MKQSEQEVLEREISAHLGTGDLEGAATTAVRGYGPQILGYLVAVMRDDEAAYEVFSQFSEDLWKGLASFRGDASFRTWAYRIAWNAAKRYRRDAYRRRGRPFLTGELSKIADEIRSSTALYRKTSVKDRVSILRESLAPQDQTLLILRVDRGLSWREVAEVMSEPEDPVDEAALRKRFERLKGKLRKLAEEQGLLQK